MLALAVESATEAAAVALADETGLLGSLVLARGRRHTETIAPAIDLLTRRLGLALTDLDLLGVDVGPGLFTGLRVGVGTVKALAFALDRPVATLTSLEVLAYALAASGVPEGRLLVPVVDARRGEVFSARFRTPLLALPDRDDAAVTLSAPEDLAADLAGLGEPLLLVGDGALRYRSLFAPLPGLTLAGPAFASPPVTALAELTVGLGLAGRVHDGAAVLPRYLRDADARINWGQRIPPRPPTTAPEPDRV
jgi:tRNA threonylcarbamoyladenosine biosynthesis protein TsaB